MIRTKLVAPVTILMSLLFFTNTRAEQVPTVAIFAMECKSHILKKKEQQGLNAYMATKLSENGVFSVIPNDRIRKLISREKNRSYSDSVDEKSRLEIGRELAAHFSINSKITKIDNQCLLMSKLFDIERATMVISATSKKSCEPEQLIKGIDEIVAQFQRKGLADRVGKASRCSHTNRPDQSATIES